MFWTKEDVDHIGQILVEVLGPQGNLIEGKDVTNNVIVATNEYGKLWYGDIAGNPEYVEGLCAVLTKRIGKNVFIVETENW